MSGSRVRLWIMAVAGAVALVTGVWWWTTYRVEVVLLRCTSRADEARPGIAPRCLEDRPPGWTERIVTITFGTALAVLVVTAALELRARWVAARGQRSLRAQT